ncbi:MAG: hypothetical protein WCB68_21210 [Pyrinomonadaceae bacterium]
MKIQKRDIWLLLVILCIAGATAIAARRSQKAASSKQERQDDASQFPIADVTAPKPTNPREIAKRKAKSKKYAQAHNDIGPGVRAVEYYHWPPGFPELPVAESDAVVIGVACKATAHLTEDETGLYSEFTIRIDEILKTDGQASLSTGDSIIADRLGGRVRYPTGEMGQFSIGGFGMPREGKRYVLFLKRGGEDEDYQIVTGYELRQGRVYPLDRSSSNETNFDIYANSDEASFLNKIRATAAKSL